MARGVYAGLKILELGSGAAGPVATRYFAEQGARVVRIESSRRPDFLRLLPNRVREHGLEGSRMFALLNPGKESVGIDLAREEGRAVAWRLARWADVVAENFAPGVMERWGLGAEALLAEKPELVVVSGCLFGQTGPQRSYPGFGGQGSAIAGFNHLTGWPDREGVGPYATITDSLSPRYVAALIAAALLERRRTGRGRRIDLSQIETGVYSLSEWVVRQAAGCEPVARRGNPAERAAPHGVYPCSGDDAWIAIAVRDDGQWQALRELMGDPDWARDPALDAAAGRLARTDELDERLAAWTVDFGAYHLMAGLQEGGVEAGVVQHLDEVLRDPQLAHRHHFETHEHPKLGPLAYERAGFRLADHPGGYAGPAPLLGEHTFAVLTELGFAPDEIAALRQDQVVE